MHGVITVNHCYSLSIFVTCIIVFLINGEMNSSITAFHSYEHPRGIRLRVIGFVYIKGIPYIFSQKVK